MQPCFGFALREARTQIGALHAVERLSRGLALLAELAVIGRQCRTDRTAGISRRGLDPDILKNVMREDFAVCHAVERHAAGQAQIVQASLLARGPRQSKHDLLGKGLYGSRDIHVELGQQFFRRPNGLSKVIAEALTCHRQAGAIIEISLVEPKRSVFLQVHDFQNL